MSVTNDLPRSIPECQGISSIAIADFITAAEQTLSSLHSFMLLRHGYVIAEGWWYPWRPQTPHMLYSLSKSFTSTAVGLAIAEGRLSVEDPVLSFFPSEAPRNVSPYLAAMQVRHLLSMSTGHDQDTSGCVFPSRTPYREFLSLPVDHVPGTHFVYNTAATFMLAAILQKLTGQTLLEYLTPRLFEPLGITGATWERHPNGVNFGGFGLNIRTEDIARFGQLYLQKGKWFDRQIVPEAWVDTATSKQVSNGNDPSSDWAQGYGYQFWRCRHSSYRADGAFGQFCLVLPQLDAVLVITAGLPDMQAALNIVWEKLLPAMQDTAINAHEPASSKLSLQLTYLAFPIPQGSATSPIAALISGRKYCFEPNYETLHSLSFEFGAESGTLSYRLSGGGKRRGTHLLKFGYGKWLTGVASLGTLIPEHVAASGVWTTDDTFQLTICRYETPFVLTITCRFEGNRAEYSMKINVSFGPLELPQLIGIAS